MTNDEKAKAYDEALERFKSFKEKYYTRDTNLGDVIFDKTGKMQKDFESIFPQLRESEDERIRKWLADYFSSIKKTVWIHRDITCEQILEWLEKQKEQVTDEPEKIAAAYQLGRSDERKQKEQKPAEWSEEDQLNLNWVIAILNGEPCDLDIQLESLISWLKSLRPQPKKGLHPGSIRKVDNPMKWMEEDEKEREQKPVTWSEEDEKRVKEAIKRIDELEFLGIHCNNVRKVLESLRPSWKPSEEQIRSLEYFISLWGDSDGQLKYSKIFNDVKSLCEQLKSL